MLVPWSKFTRLYVLSISIVLMVSGHMEVIGLGGMGRWWPIFGLLGATCCWASSLAYWPWKCDSCVKERAKILCKSVCTEIQSRKWLNMILWSSHRSSLLLVSSKRHFCIFKLYSVLVFTNAASGLVHFVSLLTDFFKAYFELNLSIFFCLNVCAWSYCEQIYCACNCPLTSHRLFVIYLIAK